MITTSQGNFVVVGANAPAPRYYWKGVELTEVISLHAHIEDDERRVKLRVSNTSTFDAAYSEMAAAGIIIKKVNQ